MQFQHAKLSPKHHLNHAEKVTKPNTDRGGCCQHVLGQGMHSTTPAHPELVTLGHWVCFGTRQRDCHRTGMGSGQASVSGSQVPERRPGGSIAPAIRQAAGERVAVYLTAAANTALPCKTTVTAHEQRQARLCTLS